MKAIWITEGRAWRMVMLRHDQSLLMLMVPRATKAQTKLC